MTPALLALISVIASAGPAAAQDVPLPEASAVKVQNKLLVKEGRLHMFLGPTVLSRGDYYDSPGASVSAAYYPWENDGLELKGAWFFSALNASGREVFERMGLIPDARRPQAAILAGWRHSLAYGKLLFGQSSAGLVHLELQSAVHAGALVTEAGAAPMLSVAPALLLRLSTWFYVQLDVAFEASFEPRRYSSVSVGLLPALFIGARL